MTNGEKIKALFPDMYQVEQSSGDWESWWNAEYKEPTTKNNLAVDKLISDCEKMSFDMEIFNKPLKVVALDAVKNIVKDLSPVTPQEPRKGYLSIDDVMSVFDDFMCGEVDEDGTATFLEMLKDKADMREVKE